MIEERHELLVGCGNRVRIIRDFNLNPVELELGNEVVERMVHNGDYVFCLVKDKPFVTVFDITKREFFARIRCSPLPFTLVSQNLIERSNIQTASKGADSANTRCMAQKSHEAEDSIIGLNVPRSGRPRSSSIGTASANTRRMAQKSHEAMDSTTGLNVPRSNRRRPSSLDSPSEIQTATALLKVKDTLWVGMSNGTILVFSIDNKFGDLVDVLRPHPMLELSDGPVTNLFHGEPGRVVACRDIKALESEIKHVTPITKQISFRCPPPSILPRQLLRHSLRKSPARCQIQVWEAWGSKDFEEFYEARKV